MLVVTLHSEKDEREEEEEERSSSYLDRIVLVYIRVMGGGCLPASLGPWLPTHSFTRKKFLFFLANLSENFAHPNARPFKKSAKPKWHLRPLGIRPADAMLAKHPIRLSPRIKSIEFSASTFIDAGTKQLCAELLARNRIEP